MRKTIPFSLVHYRRDKWVADVEEALHRIRLGEFGKIVLARESVIETHEPLRSRDLMLNLVHNRTFGTLFLYEKSGAFFVGATPELLVRKEGDGFMTMCLAGTMTAGHSEEERERAAERLLRDDKNLREHAYVVDYLRQSILDYAMEIEVPAQPSVLSLRHVQHLFTPITGRLKRGVSLVELRDRLHPTPALAGYPIEKAKSAIREMEEFNRGLYGGTFGYIDLDGDGEFSVAIRSGVFGREGGYVYAGCGVVEGSDPSEEYDELDAKLMTILSAFQGPEDE